VLAGKFLMLSTTQQNRNRCWSELATHTAVEVSHQFHVNIVSTPCTQIYLCLSSNSCDRNHIVMVDVYGIRIQQHGLHVLFLVPSSL